MLKDCLGGFIIFNYRMCDEIGSTSYILNEVYETQISQICPTCCISILYFPKKNVQIS